MIIPFTQVVQAAKDDRGWSVRQLAGQAGVGHATLYRVLRGQDVMLSSALKIATALGLNTGDLGGLACSGHRGWSSSCAAGNALSASGPDRWSATTPRGACHRGDCEPEELT